MYYRQNGFLPWVIRLLGLIILVYSVFVTLVNALSKLITNHEPFDFVITLLASLIVLAFPLWLGLLLVNMFPSIRVISAGIRYSSVSFLNGTIEWNEIEDLVLFENNYLAIIFEKRGLALLNGSYFQRLYGLLIRREGSVIFISPRTTNRQEVLDAIFQNTPIKLIKRRSQ